jgi:putative transposase
MRTSYKKSAAAQAFDRSSGSVLALNYHLVLVTRTRAKLLTSERRRCAAKVAARLLEQAGGRLLECNGEDDHLHLLISLTPAHNPAAIVNVLKSTTSRHLRIQWPPLKRRRSLWSPSYFTPPAGESPLRQSKSTFRSNNTPACPASLTASLPSKLERGLLPRTLVTLRLPSHLVIQYAAASGGLPMQTRYSND